MRAPQDAFVLKALRLTTGLEPRPVVSLGSEIDKALVERGVPAARIRTEGFSSRRPVASNTTPDGRRLNRRVEVVLLEEKVENITKGEPEGAFASAWDQLKTLIDQGLVKPVEKP